MDDYQTYVVLHQHCRDLFLKLHEVQDFIIYYYCSTRQYKMGSKLFNMSDLILPNWSCQIDKGNSLTRFELHHAKLNSIYRTIFATFCSLYKEKQDVIKQLDTYFQISIIAMKTSRPRSTEHKTITAEVWKEGLLRQLASIS